MLDRFLKLIIAGTLALFFFQAVIGVLARAFHAGLRELLGALGTVGGFIGYVLGVVIVVGFLIGLLVRATQLIANRDPRAARERATRDRAVLQRVRRPAEGVPPAESHAEVLDDPDPAIGDEERP
jgi:uncharacterized membrane protein